jgi:hypothetical protein
MKKRSTTATWICVSKTTSSGLVPVKRLNEAVKFKLREEARKLNESLTLKLVDVKDYQLRKLGGCIRNHATNHATKYVGHCKEIEDLISSWSIIG